MKDPKPPFTSPLQPPSRGEVPKLALRVDVVTIDPEALQEALAVHPVDYLFVVSHPDSVHATNTLIRRIKRVAAVPVVLCPEHYFSIDPAADALLFFSFIAERDPERLIGQHVHVAPVLKRSRLAVWPTGFMRVDLMGNYQPSADLPTVVACTALAGEQLGLRQIYLDADGPVPPSLVAAVRRTVEVPLLVGGEITGASAARRLAEAGADVVVLRAEKNLGQLPEVSKTLRRKSI
ncbi:MAG: geranylgeranylglyceryl/heptaprenylglyceryl phosphate synthase [Catalinimonas sp.]